MFVFMYNYTCVKSMFSNMKQIILHSNEQEGATTNDHEPVEVQVLTSEPIKL